MRKKLSLLLVAAGGIMAMAMAMALPAASLATSAPKLREVAKVIPGSKSFNMVPKTVALPSSEPKHAPGQVSPVDFVPEIHANITFPENSPIYQTMSVLPTSANGEFVQLSPQGIVANGGGVLVDGIYHCGTILPGPETSLYWYFAFDGETWQQLRATQVTSELMAHDLAVDPTSGKVYGCFRASDESSPAIFGTIDYTTLRRTDIAAVEKPWASLAFNASGELFAIDAAGTLSKVDKAIGSMTTIGDTGVATYYETSGAIDPYTGAYYYAQATADDKGYLYRINTSTAEATPVYQFPNNEGIEGMYVAPARADYDAPAAVGGLEAVFAGNSLSGNVNFTAPATHYDGAPANGDLQYTVTANGQTAATGKAACGAEVSVDVTVDTDALYEFAVTTANAHGTSPAASVRLYVGNDIPTTPEVTATKAGESVQINWAAVTTGVNGGYVDASAVKYTVVRRPDNVTIASATSETSLTDTPAIPETLTGYTYEVTASANGKTSAAGISNTLSLGPIVPPYLEDFSDPDCFSTLTIIDANDDGKTWYRFCGVHTPTGCARILYNSKLAMDDWLITPSLRLDAGKIYVVHFDVMKEGGATTKERIEVKFGTSPTVERMSNTLKEPVDVDQQNVWVTHTCRLKPDASGIYYIGFHGCSDKDKYYLNLDNIIVEAGAIGDAPDAVGDLTVTPGTFGRHQAEISCITPSTTFEGATLSEITKVEIARDGSVIHIVENPAPGSLVLYTDLTPEAGHHTYEVVAHNAAGAGKGASATVYIGTKTPVAPTDVKVSDNNGRVTISWKAPLKDIEGNLVDPSALTYTIAQVADGQTTVVGRDVAGTSFTCTSVEDGEQKHVIYGVFAVSDGGMSDAALSDVVPVGTPYGLHYAESFANGQPATIFAVTTDMGNGSWVILTDSSVSGVASSDDDNGYAAFTGRAYNDRASLLTGKISLADAVEPKFEFKVFNMTGSEANTNPLEVFVNDGKGFTSIKEITVAETGEPNVWNTVSVPLSQYAGKNVWFKLAGKVDNYVYTMIDDLKITDPNSGVENVAERTGAKALNVTTSPGQITISGAEGRPLRVYTASGQIFYSTPAATASATISAPAGIYLISSPSSAAIKVLVR